MGLIKKTVAVHTPTKVHTEGSSSSTVEDSKSFDMTIFRVLSSWENMKSLVFPTKIRNEFDVFLQKAEEYQAGVIDPNFAEMNEYLGTFISDEVPVIPQSPRSVVVGSDVILVGTDTVLHSV